MNNEIIHTTVTWGNELYRIEFIYPKKGFIFQVRNLTKNTIVFVLRSEKDPEYLDDNFYDLIEDIDSITSYTQFLDWLFEVLHIEDNNILASIKGYGKH